MSRHQTHHRSTPAQPSRFVLRPMVLAVHLAMVGGVVIGAGWVDKAHAQQAAPASGSQAGTATSPRHYDIPAGPLNTVLVRFLSESGVLLSGSTELARGKSSPGVKGSFAPGAALAALLAGTGLEAVADARGRYTLRTAPVASASPTTAPAPPAGIATLAEVKVTAQAERADGLPAVYAGGQVARGGRLGLLGNKDFMETPFSTISYTEEAIKNRQSGDVLTIISETDPSVNFLGGENSLGIYQANSIRGFSTNTSQNSAINGLYGINAHSNSFAAIFAERIEVIKGPTALLNGMLSSGAVGGAINMVTKKAGDTPLTRLTAGYESDSVWKSHLDIGRRFGAEKQWGVRLNAAKEGGDIPTQYRKRDAQALALGLDYRSQRLRVSADVYDYERRHDGVPGALNLASSVTQVPSVPDNGKLISGQPWTYGYNHDIGGMLRADLDLAESTSAWISVGKNNSKSKSFMSDWQVYDGLGNYRSLNNRARLFDLEYRSKAADAGLRHEFATGNIRHEVSLSANASVRSEYMAMGFPSSTFTGNIYAPTYIPIINEPDLGGREKNAETKLNSFGIADTLHLFEDSVQLTLGLRRQTVEQVLSDYKKSVTTPALGLLVKVNERISLYGNYIEGLSAGSTAPSTASNAGEVFPPYQTKQMETGVKVDWGGSFTTTLAAFQIKQPSAYTDPTTNIYGVAGEQRNRGLELNFFGEPQRGIRLLGGLAWTQGKLTKTAGGVNEGNTAVEVPEIVAKLGVEYDVDSVPGLTLTANAIHTGKQYINETNTLSVPSWRRYDLGARYATRISGKSVMLRASVFNVADTAHWVGALYRGVGDPRTFQVSASVDF